MQDLIGGQIDLSCLEASSTLANVEAGRYKAYAVLSEQRWAKAPTIPTMIESGVPGLYDLVLAWSLDHQRNARTDRQTPHRRGAHGALHPALRHRLELLGQVIFPDDQQNPQALAAYHKAELEKWWPIMKEAGIKGGNN